jgi:hypothetical protein
VTTPGATGLGWTGIALEAAKGTAEDAPTHGIPVTRSDPNDATDVLLDQGMRGSMATAYGAVAGTKSASFDIEGDLYLDTIGFFLAGIFGESDFTVSGGGGAPNTHEFSLLNSGTGQGPSYTLFHYSGIQVRKYAAATMASLTLRVSAQELLTYSASLVTHASVTDTDTVPSFSALEPLAGWVGEATIGGSANTLVQEAEITFSRNVSVVQTVDGSQTPLQIWQGPMSVSGRVMFVAAAETEFLKYLSVTEGGSPDGQVPMVLSFTQDDNSLEVTMSKCVYDSAKVETGEDFTQVSAQFTALANTTDAVGASAGFAPAKVLLLNDIATDVYMDQT